MKPRQIARIVIEDVLTAAFIAALLLTWLAGPETILEVLSW